MGRSVVTDRVFEEIERTVADALATEGVLWASTAARRVKKTYPSCAFTERAIEDLVIGFAAKAGVSVGFGHPKNSGVNPFPPESGPGFPP